MKKTGIFLVLVLILSIFLYGCGQKTPEVSSINQPVAGFEDRIDDTRVEETPESDGDESPPELPEETKEFNVKEFHVEGYKFRFEPPEIRVKVGDKVKINFESEDVNHGLKIPDFGIDIKNSGSAEFVADKSGTFIFSCSVYCGTGHSGMTGTLIVEE